MHIRIKKGYKLEEFKSLRSIEGEGRKATAEALKKSGWAGEVVFSRGNYLYTGYVREDGIVGKLLQVPA